MGVLTTAQAQDKAKEKCYGVAKGTCAKMGGKSADEAKMAMKK